MSGFLCGKVIKSKSINIKDKLDSNNHTTSLTDGKSIVNVEALKNYITGMLSITHSNGKIKLILDGTEISSIDLCEAISVCDIPKIENEAPIVNRIEFKNSINCCND